MGNFHSGCCSGCEKTSQISLSREEMLPYAPCGLEASAAGGGALGSSAMGVGPSVVVLSRNLSAEGGSYRAAEKTAEGVADDAPSAELLVDIIKSSPSDDLGLRVLHGGVGVLVVAEIFESGAVDKANIRNLQ